MRVLAFLLLLSDPLAPSEEPAYDPAGRRDPFVRIGETFGRLGHPACSGAGVQGLLIQELALRGIVLSRASPVAMLAGPDGRSYFVREGDRLCDGTVTHIHRSHLLFLQEANDPLTPTRAREVRRELLP